MPDAANVLDAWSTTKREFKDGNELLAAEVADDLLELHTSFQVDDGNGDDADMLVDMDTFKERLKIWPEDSSFCAEDVTLYTHTNAVTGDQLFYWNYGLGGNDYGTYHFLCAGKQRADAVHVLTNMDGELTFLGPSYDKFKDAEAWPKPGSDDAREASARQVAGLIKFYTRVEDGEDDRGGVFKRNSTPVDVGRFPDDEDDEDEDDED